jgi:CMP/dCMP kinase|uniref:(d)CMP kinase n=1 Tax=Candidatus Cryptobacteroides bacterium TaxID=3085639 RepID=UPI00402907DA
MHIPDIIIAIDGYSSTGKSSFAKLIAKEFSFLYLDSGALYRAITLYAMEHDMVLADGSIDTRSLVAALPDIDIHFEYAPEGSRTFIGDRCVEKEIRTIEVSSHVSPVAVIPEVRDFVDDILVGYGKNKRIVMDGRDIGTAVFPHADLKIFMTANDNVRAERRLKEMRASGQNPDFNEVLENLKSRDYIDSHREKSPLRQAEDAVVLDNSDMTLEDQMVWVKNLVKEKFGE